MVPGRARQTQQQQQISKMETAGNSTIQYYVQYDKSTVSAALRCKCENRS